MPAAVGDVASTVVARVALALTGGAVGGRIAVDDEAAPVAGARHALPATRSDDGAGPSSRRYRISELLSV